MVAGSQHTKMCNHVAKKARRTDLTMHGFQTGKTCHKSHLDIPFINGIYSTSVDAKDCHTIYMIKYHLLVRE